MFSRTSNFGLVFTALCIGCIGMTLFGPTFCSATLCTSGNAEFEIPHAISYIGVGYNIITGNPEGGDKNKGGVDPGLLVSYRVLALTCDDGKLSNDREYSIPDEVVFLHRQAASTTHETTTFYGGKSYAKKLSNQVKVSAGVNAVFASVQFAGSHRYEEIDKESKQSGYVYFSEQTIENLGHARYETELAGIDNYPLGRGFAQAACKLNDYDEHTYMTFIDTWGTHVVTEVDVGIRTGTTYQADRSSFVKLATEDTSSGASVEGSYKIVSGSLAVNMDSFNKDLSSEKKFGSQYDSYTIGSVDLQEPISIALIGMNEVFQDKYWKGMSSYVADGLCPPDFSSRIGQVGQNVLKALKGYADWKGIQNSTDPVVKVPLVWPDGQYGLPEPIAILADTVAGCPDTLDVRWSEGYIRYYTSQVTSATKDTHLVDITDTSYVDTYYCMKTVNKASQTLSMAWQPGTYCIYKYGNVCPTGFSDGHVIWKGSKQRNQDDQGGTLPKGEYINQDVKIYFCCREDGSAKHPIFLPTQHPFYLLRLHGHCQWVAGMTVRDEYVELALGTETFGTVPYIEQGSQTSSMHYCYYVPMAQKRTETGLVNRDMGTKAVKELSFLADLLQMFTRNDGREETVDARNEKRHDIGVRKIEEPDVDSRNDGESDIDVRKENEHDTNIRELLNLLQMLKREKK